MTGRWLRRGLQAAVALCIGWLPLALAQATQVATPPGARGDPRALFVVVDTSGREVSLIDGTRFERVHAFALRAALQGDPKFSSDGRFAYFGSREGWITRYDLVNLRLVVEVRAGSTLQDIALSADGQWLIASDQAAGSLILLDAGLNQVKAWAAATRDGRTASRVAAIADAPSRQSFVVALRDVAELWLISYDPKAEDIYEGLVHDFRMGEGVPTRGFHNVKRIALGEPMHSLSLDAGEIDAIGNTPARDGAAARAQVVNLDVRRRVATLPSSGTPQARAAANFASNGADMLATRNLEDGAVDVFETQTWRRVKTIAVPGPGRFLRSHPGSRHLWADSTRGGAAGDALTLIDKTTLQAVAEIGPPGHRFGDAEFSHDGRHVLVSQPGADGALIVYDATTLQEVKRLPMHQPSGVFGAGKRAARPAAGMPAR
jgi:hypothetical protein